MKSQQKKKRIARDTVTASKSQEARDSSPALQKLYDTFTIQAIGPRMPKFSSDPWGNRIPTEEARLLWVLKNMNDQSRNEIVNA